MVEMPHIVVHTCLSTEIDFDHSKALKTVLQDCTDEQIVAEFAQRLLDHKHDDVEDKVKVKYHFERMLGKGASGIVHLVFEKATGKGYACKILVKNKMNDVKSLKTELDIMKKVHHENVVLLVEVFESPQCLWMIMELTNSGDLRSVIKNCHKFSEHTTCRLIKQVLEGVHYLHSQGIIHRDLKIDNILIDGDFQTGIVKIADFGLSGQVVLGSSGYHPSDSSKRKKFTGMTDRWGTVTHCSPELLFKRAYGPQTDMWSVGCMTYEMLTGVPAFTINSADQKFKYDNLYRKIRGALYNKEKLKDISACGRSLLEQLIEVNPAKRLTASEALLHPWFTTCLGANDFSKNCPGDKVPIFAALTRAIVLIPEGMIHVLRADSNAPHGSSNTNIAKKSSLLKANMVNDSMKMEEKRAKSPSVLVKKNSMGRMVQGSRDNIATKVSSFMNYFRSTKIN